MNCCIWFQEIRYYLEQYSPCSKVYLWTACLLYLFANPFLVEYSFICSFLLPGHWSIFSEYFLNWISELQLSQHCYKINFGNFLSNRLLLIMEQFTNTSTKHESLKSFLFSSSLWGGNIFTFLKAAV